MRHKLGFALPVRCIEQPAHHALALSAFHILSILIYTPFIIVFSHMPKIISSTMPTCGSATNSFYHQCLRGVSHLKQASTPSNAATLHPLNPVTPPSHFQWDLAATSTSIYPALDFISQQLVKHGLQISLLVSDQAPFVIPVWELPEKSQIILTKTIRKACNKFRVSPSWMTAMAALDGKKELPRIFEQHKPDSYIIRRSLLQREIVYSAEGLMLLSVDHIYTLKQLLCTLSKPDWVLWSRHVCLSSCVHLLRRINAIHDGTQFTKAYMARVYLDVPFAAETFDEVNAEYDATYCTANIRDVVSEADFASSCYTDFEAAETMNESKDGLRSVVELQNTEVNEFVSPLTGVDVKNICPWNFEPQTPSLNRAPINVSVTYPEIKQPTSLPLAGHLAEVWYDSPPTSPDSDESWGPDAPPSPLKIVKRPTSPMPQKLSIASSGLSSEEGPEEIEEEIEEEEEDGSRRLSLEALEQQEAELRRKDIEEKSRLIVEAWSKGVQEVVCARCFDAIEDPARYTVCY